jgi:hypothetical protein
MDAKRSLKFGFMIAPLSVTITYITWALLFWTDLTPKQEFSDFNLNTLSAWALLIIALTLFSYLWSVVLGIPLVVLLRKINKLSFGWITLFSLPLGALALNISILLFLLVANDAELTGPIELIFLQITLIGCALGAIVAVSFCALVGIPLPLGKHIS